jgi:hypothetical protein
VSTSSFCSWHRVPRAHIDPIRSQSDALAVIGLAASDPAVDETIVVLLDDEHRGISLIVVDGTADDDAIVHIVEWLGDANDHLDHDAAAMIVASMRPDSPVRDADVDAWIESSDLADDHGVRLLEWFVISGGEPSRRVGLPRELLGEEPRW